MAKDEATKQKEADEKAKLKAAKDAEKKQKAEQADNKENMSTEDRVKLNDKARYDYGIMNADEMSEKQLKDEIAALEKQRTDAEKQDQKTKDESEQNGETQNKPDVAGKN